MKKWSANFEVPQNAMRCLMRKEGCIKYWPIFINDCSCHDVAIWWQVCATLLHTFQRWHLVPALCSLMNAQYCISVQGFEVFYVCGKWNLHLSEEVAQHLTCVMMWAGVASELIITGESYLELLSHSLNPEVYSVGLLSSVILQQYRHQLCWASWLTWQWMQSCVDNDGNDTDQLDC